VADQRLTGAVVAAGAAAALALVFLPRARRRTRGGSA
jgi:hypothetical protein